ncbi:MAG: YbdK family carboxylate-amine ligase [Thermodesulfobacteriota bacterium]
MKIDYNGTEDLTLGVELELQLLDSESLELASRSSHIIEALDGFGGSVKHELMRSNLEVISKKCYSVAEAEDDLSATLVPVIREAKKQGVLIAAASTHPFSRWKAQSVTLDKRYGELLDNLQMVARRFNIFGLHVHVGIRSAEKCIYVMNRLLYYLPHLLALSSNSPYWEGEDTGLKSYRIKVFENLPIGGLPFYFHNFADYSKLVNTYIATGTIKTIRELWWDVRPHPNFGTIEVRICDIPSTLGEVMAVASFIQALVKKFGEDFDRSVCFKRPHSAIIRENKWRACRYGLGGEFITEDGTATIGARKAIVELLRWCAEGASSLGTESYLADLEDMLTRGDSGATRQLEVCEDKGGFKGLCRELARIFEAGVLKARGPGGGES